MKGILSVLFFSVLSAGAAHASHPDCKGNKGVAQVIGNVLESRWHLGRCTVRIELRFNQKHAFCPMEKAPSALNWITLKGEQESCSLKGSTVSGILTQVKSKRWELSSD